MSTIITMNSKEFLKKFIRKYDYRDYQFLLISNNIKSTGKHKEAYSLDSLTPTSLTLSTLINGNDKKAYKRKYLNHLSSPKNDGLITLIMKLMVFDEADVILLCTEEEESFGYMKLLKEYIEGIYGVDVYSFKKYDKDPDSAESVSNPKRTVKILKKKLQTMDKRAVTGEKMSKKAVRSKLNELTKKELKMYAKERGIIIPKGVDKEALVKFLTKIIYE